MPDNDDAPPSKAPKSKRVAAADILTPVPSPAPSKYGKGYKPDKSDHFDGVSKLLRRVIPMLTARAVLGAPFRLAAEATLENLIAQIYNQGATSSCVGWAFAQNLWLRMQKLGTPIELPSPMAFYTLARALERMLSGAGPSTPLTDDGSSPWLAVQGLAEWGVPSISAWPFDPSLINAEPDLAELEAASACEIQGYHPISSDGLQLLADIRQSLDGGFPVAFGTAVDQAFEDYDGTTIIGAPDPAQLKGGHMMNCVGYRSDGTFRILNQWGNSWGDSGMATVSGDFFTNPYMMGAFILTANATGHMGNILPPDPKEKS